jgi:GT2 family glycosyltransferase
MGETSLEDSYTAEVSVIIVSYNTREMTLACLASAYTKNRSVSMVAIVVDNASSDGSAAAIAERFPQVRLIASERNHGFASANNLAAREAQGKYLLLLNPDTVVLNRAIDNLVEFAEQYPEAGIYGGRTLYGDGTLNPTSCWRAPTLWGLLCRALGLDNAFKGSALFNRDAYGGWQRDTVREVDIVSGCFLLIRREIWDELGGFDPEFFMYGEDWDLCMRARKLGYRSLFCPEAQIIHYGGASEPLLTGRIVRLIETKARLCRKHWSPAAAWIATHLLDAWVITRLAGYAALGIFSSEHNLKYDNWKGVWVQRDHWKSKSRR